jgi:regulatory protein
VTLSTSRRRLHAVPDPGPPDERDAGRPPEPDADPYEVAREICLRRLAGRSCTRAELATELRRRNVPDDAATTALDRLDAVGLIDDAAFAATWVDRQVRTRGLSRRAMTGELRRKGVDAEAAAEAVAVVSDDDERRRAAELVARKLSSVRSLDRQKQVSRLVGMLARKGYGGDVAYAVVRAALGDLDEEG